MTEKLKQKAKKWVKENTHTEPSAIFGEITVYPSAEKGYIAGATEATKELQEELDYAKSNCLFSDCDRVVRLKSQITELEAQIEEMKRCLSEWFKYENERDYELNVDELLIETRQLIEKE